MQKLLKSKIIYFILGVTIAIGITSVFAYDLFASNIGFTPTDDSWKKYDGNNIENVSDALDDLNSKIHSLAYKKVCRYVNNQFSHDPDDHYSAGTMYECEVADGVKKNF